MHATTSHVLLFAICTTFFLAGSDGRSCFPDERDALISFKKGVVWDPANPLSSWHGQDCCQWRGVRCSNETGHIYKLQIRNQKPATSSDDGCDDANSLFGEISPSLLSLEYLEHLDLSMNCFTGKVPSFQESMKKLRYLNLSGITFTGEVPPQLGNLSKLQYLDLGSKNSFSKIYSADITWLKTLPKLQYLSMSHVNLSKISDWPHVLNSIPSLKVISLSSCSLGSANQSIPYLNLTKLEILDLSWNYINDEIASCWFWKVTSLRYLYLSNNRFFGQFNDALESMGFLRVLDLSSNLDNNLEMKGNFKNLCSLEILYLTENDLNGELAVLLDWLPHCLWDTLQELHLGLNYFNGALPSLIGRFTSLTLLDLSNNSIIGSIPPELGNCSSLVTLHLSNNHLIGSIPPELAGCSSLVTLDLSSNNFNGSIPPELANFSSLVTLDLSKNQLNGTIPIELCAYANLTSLALSNNNFSGVITEQHFARLMRLEKIDLSSNSLTVVVDKHWCAPFSLKVALFESCQMGPLFPAWLQQ